MKDLVKRITYGTELSPDAVEMEIRVYIESLLPENPYKLPQGNPDLGFPDPDKEKRNAFDQVISLIRNKLNEIN